ncbi:MAG: DUF4419 domain-containing protein [Bacteroidales bacterium]|nr:DUF4419 domain-containing protein [Bacteroidales bacterium]
MKKRTLSLLLFFVCLPMMLSAQQTKTESGITFVVDENLPAPVRDKYSSLRGGKELAKMVAGHANVAKPADGLVASSFERDSMLYCTSDVLYNTMVRCFAEHRPLVLSPDMVWLVIAQNFSYYVNEHADELRSKLVSHDGKISLVVNSQEDLVGGHPDWSAIMTDFERQIAQHSKADICHTITADFTTTGPTERIASQITLMDAMKSYFEYIVHTLACGIPTITLQGTPQDWQKVHDKAMALKKYGMGWWTKDLDPILKEFVRASQGKPNQAFWKDMVMKDTPLRLRGGGCSFEGPTELDGWFLKLFPYDKDGVRTPEKVAHTRQMLSEMVRVPFRYVVTAPSGQTLSDTSMELFAGLVSVKEDPVTLALTPQIGWMVRMGEGNDAMNDGLKRRMQTYSKRDSSKSNSLDGSNPFGLELRVKRVPEALREAKAIDRLSLYFVDRVELPQWMDSIDIQRLTVHGKVTQKQAKRLKARFPHINLDRPVDAPKEKVEKKSRKKNVKWKRVVSDELLLKLDSVVTQTKDGGVRIIIPHYDSLQRVESYSYKSAYAKDTIVYHIEYDADSKPLRMICKDAYKYRQDTRYEYDKSGRKVLEYDDMQNDSLDRRGWHNCYAYAYDDAGRMIVKDCHKWSEDFQPSRSHVRYVYHYNKKGMLTEVLQYEYFLDALWARIQDVPHTVRMELQERATYDKKGRIIKHENLPKETHTLYTYDSEGRLAYSEFYKGDVFKHKTIYSYDSHGNLIAQETIDEYGYTLQNSIHMSYHSNYQIEEVAGLRDGLWKHVFPSLLQGDEFYRPTLHRPVTLYSNLGDHNWDDEGVRRFYYSRL